jgi:hypothetical protein
MYEFLHTCSCTVALFAYFREFFPPSFVIYVSNLRRSDLKIKAGAGQQLLRVRKFVANRAVGIERK